MTFRESLFAALTAIACSLVVAGVGSVHRPSGLIVGGVLLGGWAWLVLAETRR
jgi:hypothetical protein